MIVLDIGANAGHFSRDILETSKKVRVLAVEPNLKLFEKELLQIVTQFPGRFSIDFRAVDRTAYRGVLNHSNSRGGQLASLKNINPRSTGWQSEHLEFTVSDSFVTVDVTTPALLLQEHGLSEIDFIKIDIQGNDVEVLESFLDCSRVRSGVIEVDCGFARGEERYLESDNNEINELFRVLQNKGLVVTKITPNNASLDELNVFFGESVEESRMIMQQLGIATNPAFARFWRIQGLGLSSEESVANLSRSIIVKIIHGLRHPIQSLESLIVKLSR
jgi:FkbM family methyltransferase